MLSLEYISLRYLSPSLRSPSSSPTLFMDLKFVRDRTDVLFVHDIPRPTPPAEATKRHSGA